MMRELKFDTERKNILFKGIQNAQNDDQIIRLFQNTLTYTEYHEFINELKESWFVSFLDLDDGTMLPMWMEMDEKTGFSTGDVIDNVSLNEFKSITRDYVKYLED